MGIFSDFAKMAKTMSNKPSFEKIDTKTENDKLNTTNSKYSNFAVGYVGFAQKIIQKEKILGYNIVAFRHIGSWNFEEVRFTIAKEQIIALSDAKKLYIINYYERNNNIPVVRIIQKNKNQVENILKTVRKYMVDNYGDGTNLAGKCIMASELIVKLLHLIGFNEAKAVEGWCHYDYEDYGSDRPYDEHTWVELGDYYLDVTADQFNLGMEKENEFEGIIFNHGLPHGMCYEEPNDYDEDEDNY